MKTSITIFISLFIFFSLNGQVFVNHSATGNNDGTTWADAYSNLQDAMDNAPIGSQLWIAVGTYKPSLSTAPDSNYFHLTQQLELYGGFVGDETMLSERDWATNPTILDADMNGDDIENNFFSFRSDNAIHVMLIQSPGVGTVIDGLTFKSGDALNTDIPNGTTDTTPWQGGVTVRTPIVMRNCIITQCKGALGGAFYMRVFSSLKNELLMENCTIENNYSEVGTVSFTNLNSPVIRNSTIKENFAEIFGGGLRLGNTNCLIEDCIIENNECGTSIGGGILIFQNSANQIIAPLVEIRRTQILSNTGFFGGGLCFNNFFPNSQIILDSCEIKNNGAASNGNTGGLAGGLFLQNLEDTFGGGNSSLTATISNCTIEGNEGIFGGGGYFFANDDGLNITVENTEFYNNISEDFGGGLVVGNCLATFNNCVFDRNKSNTSIGGGLFFFNNSLNTHPQPTYEVFNSTFSDNTAELGGGLAFNNFFPESEIIIENCDFTQNVVDETQGAGGGLLLQSFPDGNGSDVSLSVQLTNSHFENNRAAQGAGAEIVNGIDTLEFNSFNNEFVNNSARWGGGMDITGAGGIIVADLLENDFLQNNATLFAGGLLMFDVADISLKKSRFTNNDCKTGAAALQSRADSRLTMETVLFNNNTGSSTIVNEDSIWMLNVTMVDNSLGLFQFEDGYLELQNSIFSNNTTNFTQDTDGTVVTKGGNISSDNSLVSALVGFGGFNDFNDTDPSLDMNYVPEQNSAALDAGNSSGVTLLQDLNDNDRINGTIDAGAFENSMFTSSKNLETIVLQIYPNPFIDHIVITNIDDIDEIIMLDVTGRILSNLPVQQTIYLNKNLPSGVYFLKIKINGEEFMKKIEKK